MKRLFTLILALLLVCTCFCAALAETDGLDPFEETVTMRIMANNNSAYWFPEGEDITNNVLIDYYKERLNIDIVSDWVTDTSNYTSQIDLMIAGDDLPDVFLATAQQLYRLAQNGQIQPIGEVYDTYVSDAVKAELGDSSALYFAQGTVDGEVYGFPYTEDYHNYMPLMWVRTDWLEQVGMEKPETWEDYEAVMQAFMDQCGAKYGVAFNISDKGSWGAFLNPFKAYYQAWVEQDDGAITYSAVTEETRQALEKMHEWYEKGYLSPEFATSQFNTVRSDVGSGDVGIFIAEYYPEGYLAELFAADPDVNWTVCPIPTCEDGTYAVEGKVTPSSFIVVNSDYEHPEALIKYMNLWHDMWRGASGEYYHGLNNTDYVQAGENFKFYVPFWFDPPMKNMTHSSILWDIWPDGDITPYEGDYELMKQWDGMHAFLDGDKTHLSGYAHILCYIEGFWTDANIYNCLDESAVFVDAFTGPLSDDYANYKAVVDSTMSEYFTAAVMGAKNLEGDWDAFVSAWNAAGGNFMTSYVNEWKAAQ